MSFDAVSLIRQFITPEIIGRIASALGLERSIANSAVGALIPSILAGLLGASQRPGGVGNLSQAINAQDPGLLTNLGSLLNGGSQRSLIDNGASVLGSLLGGSSANALASAVGRFSGAGDVGAKSLMGMLAPVVLGALGKQQSASGLDASGLVNLLAGQKDNIARAMPAGFAKELQGTGLLDSIASHLPRADVTPPTAARASGGRTSWLPWVAGLVFLGSLIWVIASRDAPTTTSHASVDVTTVQGASQHLQFLSDRLQMALGTVTDEVSAKAAVPRLAEIASEVERLQGAASAFPAAERSTLATIIRGLLATIAPKIERILKIPGVEPVLKPILGTLEQKLQKIGGL